MSSPSNSIGNMGSQELDTEVASTDINKRKKLVSTWGLPEPVMCVGTRTVFTHGRPPWYNTEGQAQQPFVIGICGGSASGKTSVARAIIESLDVQWVSLLSMDSYYKDLSDEQKRQAAACNYNFDHPNAFDFGLLVSHLARLREGKSIEVPEYDFKTHSRTSKTKTLYGANVVIIEGILAFYSSEVTKLMDMKVFVDTDADERLARRLRRDISDRDRVLSDVLEQYTRFVKPAYEQFIAPCMALVDVIIPRGGQNSVALQLIVQHINKRLKQHGLSSRQQLVKLVQDATDGAISGVGAGGDCHTNGTGEATAGERRGSQFSHFSLSSSPSLFPSSSACSNALEKDFSLGNGTKFSLPPCLHLLPTTAQTIGLHTLIRDRNTDQNTFIFYAERIMRRLCEHAMNLLPHMDVEVETPQGTIYHGRQLSSGTQVCGVSILRAGETLEASLCAVYKDVRLGKILIQTNPITSEPELHYIRLPRDIKDCFVILMDSTVATGAAAIMAMRILVEHDVPEERIILTSLIMAIQGVYSIAYTYPKAHIVTTAVDDGLNENYHIIPGIGNFGDRYFGTTLNYSGTV